MGEICRLSIIVSNYDQVIVNYDHGMLKKKVKGMTGAWGCVVVHPFGWADEVSFKRGEREKKKRRVIHCRMKIFWVFSSAFSSSLQPASMKKSFPPILILLIALFLVILTFLSSYAHCRTPSYSSCSLDLNIITHFYA